MKTPQTIDRNENPRATKKPEFLKLLRVLKPTKKDVFYDLGCGYGYPCLWISDMVKCCVGIENYLPHYRKARENIGSKRKNVEIVNSDYNKISLKGATIIYSTLCFPIHMLAKIKRETEQGTRLVSRELPPPYPIKSKNVERFYLFKTPYERVSNEDEYAKIFLGDENVTAHDMFDFLDTADDLAVVRKFKDNIMNGEANWKAVK